MLGSYPEAPLYPWLTGHGFIENPFAGLHAEALPAPMFQETLLLDDDLNALLLDKKRSAAFLYGTQN